MIVAPTFRPAPPSLQTVQDAASAARTFRMEGTKVDQILEPTHQIAFSGSDRIAEIAFSPDGTTVYCLMPAEAVDLWAFGVSWWPELLGGALTLIVLVYLVLLVRVLRRPQRRGMPHCRKCNYDVTVQAPDSVRPRRERRDAAAGTLCPECGTDLSVRWPRRGRSFARRLIVPSCVLGVLIAGYVSLHAARVPRTGPMGGAPEVWSAWVDGLAERHQIGALLKHRITVARIMKLDTGSGKTMGELCTMRGYPAGDMRVSPDGRHIAVVGDSTTLRWIRTSNGRTAATTTGGEFRGGGIRAEFVVGFAGQRDALWVYYAAVDQASGKSRLMQWRPRDRSQVMVVEEPAYEMTYGNGVKGMQARRYALLHRPEGVATVSAPDFSEAYHTQKYELTVRGPIESGSRVERVVPVKEQFVITSPLVPTPDGRLLFLSAATGGIIGFDMHTGEHLGAVRPSIPQTPDRTLTISADGERLFIPVFRNAILVRDIVRKRWIAQLNLPEEFIGPQLQASLDGRWLGVVAFQASGPGRGARYMHEVFLYDLSALGRESSGDSSAGGASEEP